MPPWLYQERRCTKEVALASEVFLTMHIQFRLGGLRLNDIRFVSSIPVILSFKLGMTILMP